MSHASRPVSDYMSVPVFTIRADDALADANRHMQLHRVSSLLVVGADGRKAGVVSRTDLLRVGLTVARPGGGPPALQLPPVRVGDLMTAEVIGTAPSATVAAAARQMVERRIHRLFVFDGDRPAGVLSTKDVMRAVADQRIAAPISGFMSSPVQTVEAGEPIARAMERLTEAQVTGLVVIDDGAPVGLFTQEEALESHALGGSDVESFMNYSLVCLPLTTPLFRAAAFAAATRARRVLAVENRDVRGILTGLDFARAIAA
jgi:predicted transcriptional regulator